MLAAEFLISEKITEFFLAFFHPDRTKIVSGLPITDKQGKLEFVGIQTSDIGLLWNHKLFCTGEERKFDF